MTNPWTDVPFLRSAQGDAFFDDADRLAARSAYDDALQRWFAYADAHPSERSAWGGPPQDWNTVLDAYGENLERAESAAYARALRQP